MYICQRHICQPSQWPLWYKHVHLFTLSYLAIWPISYLHCLIFFCTFISYLTQVLVSRDCFMDRWLYSARAHHPSNDHSRGEQFDSWWDVSTPLWYLSLRFQMFTPAWPLWTCRCWCQKPVWQWTCLMPWVAASTWGWSCPRPRWPWMPSTPPAMSWPPAPTRTWSLLSSFPCCWLCSPYPSLCSEWSY